MSWLRNKVLCPRCGEKLPIVRSQTRLDQNVIPEHACQRVLVGTYYVDAKAMKVLTSLRPGETCPSGFVRMFGTLADEWRVMDSLTGWAYFWQPMAQATEKPALT